MDSQIWKAVSYAGFQIRPRNSRERSRLDCLLAIMVAIIVVLEVSNRKISAASLHCN